MHWTMRQGLDERTYERRALVEPLESRFGRIGIAAVAAALAASRPSEGERRPAAPVPNAPDGLDRRAET
jgi:hypothetical protein